MSHAGDFIAQRLAPAEPKNDGKQTPWKGHPVFIAQHATATCCRGCLEKWYKIAKKKPLTKDEQAYILLIIHSWLVKDLQKHQ
ncbi:putative cytoplasmic protein [Commensalibacter intestini A911]|nr:putative cytoplasmic protein [Commensalibacter intestini A911]